MKIKIAKIACVVLLITASAKAQLSIEDVLVSVLKNNQSIIANKQHWEAKKIQFKTGLTPDNPTFEYDYLNGSSGPGSGQTELSIVQNFDFPTSYIKRSQVAFRQIEEVEYQLEAFKEKVLLDAKKKCVELVFLQLRQKQLDQRLRQVQRLLVAYQKQYESGDISILELNKMKLRHLNFLNEQRKNGSLIQQKKYQIIDLNGGEVLQLSGLNYPTFNPISDFFSIEKAIESNDPTLKLFEKQKETNLKQLQLTKSLVLPKIELGYRSNTMGSQQFSGTHLGLTIPLWENRNTVKFQKAHQLFRELQVDHHITEHHNEIKQLYERYSHLKQAVNEYEVLLKSINNLDQLETLLNIGEISLLEYFLEVSYFYDSYDQYLEQEMEYHIVAAELYKYEL